MKLQKNKRKTRKAIWQLQFRGKQVEGKIEEEEGKGGVARQASNRNIEN